VARPLFLLNPNLAGWKADSNGIVGLKNGGVLREFATPCTARNNLRVNT
jgi:hypothetical protein